MKIRAWLVVQPTTVKPMRMAISRPARHTRFVAVPNDSDVAANVEDLLQGPDWPLKDEGDRQHERRAQPGAQVSDENRAVACGDDKVRPANQRRRATSAIELVDAGTGAGVVAG